MAGKPANIQVPELVDNKILSRILGVTGQTVNQLVHKGVIVRAERGRYYFFDSVTNYIKYVRTGERSTGSEDYQFHRARKVKAQAEKEERLNKIAEGQLLSRELIHSAVTDAFLRVRGKILGMSNKVAALIVGMDSIPEIKSIIDKHVEDALRELSNTNVSDIGLTDATSEDDELEDDDMD